MTQTDILFFHNFRVFHLWDRKNFEGVNKGRNLDPFPLPPTFSKKSDPTNEKSKNYEKIKYPSGSSRYIPDHIFDIPDTF